MPEADAKPPSSRYLRVDQMIRAHAIRAASIFYSGDETVSEADLFDLAKRIVGFIEGRRRDT